MDHIVKCLTDLTQNKGHDKHIGRSRGGAWRGAVAEAATFRAGMGSRAPFIAAEIADRALERVHRTRNRR